MEIGGEVVGVVVLEPQLSSDRGHPDAADLALLGEIAPAPRQRDRRRQLGHGLIARQAGRLISEQRPEELLPRPAGERCYSRLGNRHSRGE